MKSILLCGCGNIGFRHLQAMIAMPEAASITIVEPNLEVHDRIAATFTVAEIKGFRIDLRVDLPAKRRSFDLVVIATSADARRAAFDSVFASHDAHVVIFEKVLFQTIADLTEVGIVLASRGIAAYVNCPRRYFPGYREIIACTADARPLDVTVRGSAFGLASNGVHLIDLAEYLNGAALTSFQATGLRAGSVEAKRAGCVEVFGQLEGQLANGARLEIICEDRDPISICITVEGPDFVAEIDEITGSIKINEAEPTAFAVKYVSEIWEIYHEALTIGRCSLTPYRESANQHRLFLSALSSHLGLGAVAPCPIS